MLCLQAVFLCPYVCVGENNDTAPLCVALCLQRLCIYEQPCVSVLMWTYLHVCESRGGLIHPRGVLSGPLQRHLFSSFFFTDGFLRGVAAELPASGLDTENDETVTWNRAAGGEERRRRWWRRRPHCSR